MEARTILLLIRHRWRVYALQVPERKLCPRQRLRDFESHDSRLGLVEARTPVAIDELDYEFQCSNDRLQLLS